MAKSSTSLLAGDGGAIERRPLFRQLADQLREMILAGDFEPGERLQEMELSARFGVSRTPFREALKVLSSEGLVTLSPNKGAAISQLTDEELAEVFPVMGAFEGLAGELACLHISDDEITDIATLHDEMVESFKQRALQNYYATNQKIHAALFAAARNATLSKQYDLLAGRVRRARFRGGMSEQRWAQAVDEHEQMLAALRVRDGRRLGEILRRHADTKFETVRESLEDAEGGAL